MINKPTLRTSDHEQTASTAIDPTLHFGISAGRHFPERHTGESSGKRRRAPAESRK